MIVVNQSSSPLESFLAFKVFSMGNTEQVYLYTISIFCQTKKDPPGPRNKGEEFCVK
jgi:hypothetical protein